MNLKPLSLFICLLHLSNLLSAQYFLHTGADTTVVNNGFKVLVHYEPRAKWELLNLQSEKYEFRTPRKVGKNTDSVTAMVGGKFAIRTTTYRWDTAYTYIDRLTCKNGMMLIFRDGRQLEGYYPEENTVELSNGSTHWFFNALTGEYEPDPNGLYYSPSKKLRVWEDNSTDNTVYFLQTYHRKQKKFCTIANLSSLLSVQNGNFYWDNNTLYIAQYACDNTWWSITVK